MAPFFISPALRAALCALALLLAAGCSAVRIGYNQLDTIAGWMAHDYFDLDPAQRDDFARRFERLHGWHRSEQLPEYAKFLAEFRNRARRGLQAQDMQWLVEGIKSRYGPVAARAAPDAADLLARLSPQQIAHLRRELDEANRKFLREHRSNEGIEARRQARDRRMLSQLRDWVGPLSEAQQQRFTALLQQIPLNDRLRHDDRLRRQKEFLALLERRGDKAAFARQLEDWLVHWERSRTAEQARAFEDYWQRRAAFYAGVDRLLTTEQRTHLLHRLQDYIADFQELAGRGAAVARND